MIRPAAFALLLLLPPACSEKAVEKTAPPVLGNADAYLPMELGTRWSYRVLKGDEEIRIDTHQMGGDMRVVEGKGKLRYDFVYGRPEGEDHDTTKSIYEMDPTGPHLFFFDAWIWRIQFEPPLRLLPAKVEAGATWKWEGTLGIGNDDVATGARLEVVAVEELDLPAGRFSAIRTKQIHEKPDLTITRWFAKHVGLIRELQVLRQPDGSEERREVTLLEFGRD